VATGQQVRAFRTPNDFLYGVTFTPDGRSLLVDDVGGQRGQGAANHALTVWDARADQAEPDVIGIIGRHAEAVWCLKFSPDGRQFVSGSNDGTINLWPWDPARPALAQKPAHRLPVRHYGFGDCAAFSPAGDRLATVAGHGIKIWDARTGHLLQTHGGHTGDIHAVAYSPDGRWLASAGQDTTVALRDAATGEKRHTLRGHTGLVMSLAFSPDGKRLVSGGRDSTVKVWDMTRWDKPLGR
jgi:WD40 repeat protein